MHNPCCNNTYSLFCVSSQNFPLPVREHTLLYTYTCMYSHMYILFLHISCTCTLYIPSFFIHTCSLHPCVCIDICK